VSAFDSPTPKGQAPLWLRLTDADYERLALRLWWDAYMHEPLAHLPSLPDDSAPATDGAIFSKDRPAT